MVEEKPSELAASDAGVNAALCNGAPKAAADTLCGACGSGVRAVCGRDESRNAADNIVLIGMPGAGKSTLGVVLAKILNYDFLDADLVIQNKHGKTLQTLINEYGPQGFLDVENQDLQEINVHRTIIATGGSAVYSDRAMEHLRSIGTVVYLQISYKELANRLGDLQERGVVMKGGMGMSLADLYEERLPLYEKWADITDTSGEFGVSILTDCKHGWDKPDNNTLRLTCIHSPLGAFTKETRQDLQDLGRNCFSFGIYGHKGDIENGTNKESMNFARKLITCEVKKSESKGEFSQIASLLKITHDNIVIRAVKMSEDDENALIVRLNNATAIEQKNAALSVYREFEKVDEVNTSEEFIRNHAEVNGKVIRVTLKPFETITLKIKFAKSEECENNNTYSPMRLNYNVKAFTNYDNMKHIILQGGGYSLPIDLIDRNIKVNGIEFYIPHGNRKNKKPKYDAVACRGQSINLDGKYNQIYILAGAVSEEDIVGTFKIDRKDYDINFKSMTAPYSKWDMYGLGQTAHTDDETAFGYEFTHLHHPEGNLVKKARMYLYSLNVKNKKRLRFPNNNKLVIFAMTSAEKEEFTNLADNVIDIVDDNYDFGKIPPIDKITDKTDAITIRAGKIQDQYNGGKGQGFLRDNLITNIIRSYTKSEW